MVSTVPGRGWLGYLFVGALFVGLGNPPGSVPILKQSGLALASVGLAGRHGELRLQNGALLLFEELDSWQNAAVSLALAVPRVGRADEETILLNLAQEVLTSGCEAGLPEMLGEGRFLEEGLRCQRRGEAILLTLEVPPAELGKAGEFLAGILDLSPRPVELAPYIERMGRRLAAGGFTTEATELVRDLALGRRPAPTPPQERLPAVPTPEELLLFLQDIGQPANVTVSVCAPRLSEATVSLFAGLFGVRPPADLSPRYAGNRVGPGATTVQPSAGQRVYHFPGRGPLVKICVAFALPCTSRREYWTARALAATLVGPRFSRLYQSLRRREGLAYRMEGRVERSGEKVAVLVECLVPRKASGRVEDLLLAEMERLTSQGASGDECQRAQEHLKAVVMGQWQRPVEAAAQRAEEGALGEGEEVDTPPWEVIDSLTSVEINSGAQGAKGKWFVCVYG